MYGALLATMEGVARRKSAPLALQKAEHQGSLQLVPHSRLPSAKRPDPHWSCLSVSASIRLLANLNDLRMTLSHSGFYWLSGHHYILEKFQLSALFEKNMDWPTHLENGSAEEIKHNSREDEDFEQKSLSQRSS